MCPVVARGMGKGGQSTESTPWAIVTQKADRCRGRQGRAEKEEGGTKSWLQHRKAGLGSFH